MNTVIIDNGSKYTRAGFSNDEYPKIFPTIVGKSKEEDTTKFYVGQEAYEKRNELSIKYPIDCRHICSFDDMEKIWHYVYNDILKSNSEEYPILLTEEYTFNNHRERKAQILFESFNVPALYLAEQSVLSLYAIESTTGLVIDAGYARISFSPVYEGHLYRQVLMRPAPFGGVDLTEYLIKLLNEKGHTFQTTRENIKTFDIVKEELCYVGQDYHTEITKTTNSTKTYKLPDGEIIHLENERFQVPEALFNKHIHLPGEYSGIHEFAYNSIMKCDETIRNEISTNILLTGGTMKLPGMVKRMKKEIETLVLCAYSPKIDVNVIASTSEHSSWLGGRILANSSFFEQICISKEEYNEYGPSMVGIKCF